VKRVIGLPGDHIKLVDQRLFVNGKLLNEPYVVHDPAVGYDPLNYNFPPQGVQLYSSPVIPEWAHQIKKYVTVTKSSCRRASILRWGQPRP